MGKTRDLFKKTGDTKGTFHTKMGTMKKRSKREGRKGKIYPSECRVPENSKRLEVSSIKLEISREHFMQGWAQ